MIDVFEIKIHYPITVFLYQSRIKSIYEFYKFLNKLKEETLIIPNDNFEFFSLDELDYSSEYKLKKVFVPKGKELLKIFLGFLGSLNIYHYFVPIPKSNPFGKKLLNKEKRDEKWYKNWQSLLRYLNLIKNKVIRFNEFEEEFLGLIISDVKFSEPNFKIGEFVKLKNKPIYGKILEIREKSIFLDNGEFYNKEDLFKVIYEPSIYLKPSDSQFIINFFIKEINNELIKYGFELKRKHFEFEKVNDFKEVDLEEFLRNKKIKIVFKNEKIAKKFLNYNFPFEISHNSEISFLIDSLSYLKNLKKLYREIAKKFLNFDCPRIYSKEAIKLKLKNGNYIVGKNFLSVICSENEIDFVLSVL